MRPALDTLVSRIDELVRDERLTAMALILAPIIKNNQDKIGGPI